MILLVQDRKNNFHIVDYCDRFGGKYTMCEAFYSKKDIINTIELDRPVRITCGKCTKALANSFSYKDVRKKFDRLDFYLKYRYNNIQNRVYQLSEEYEDLPRRVWYQLYRYKRKLSKR